MATYKTPGVYVEEISTLPASIAPVETAIPAFLGYTEKADKNGKPLTNKPLKISSFLEYMQYFGGAEPRQRYHVTLDANDNPISVEVKSEVAASTYVNFHLYNAVRMFYANGGGDCYIVSIGLYESVVTTMALAAYTPGLAALAAEDEPTLILAPDAVNLSADDLGSLQVDILAQCAKLQDRFGVFDIKETGDLDADASAFRNNVGVNDLKYGAAYTPYIHASLPENPSLPDMELWRDGMSPTSLDFLTIAQNGTAATAFTQASNDYDTVSLAIEDPAFVYGTSTNWPAAYAAVPSTGTIAELNHYIDVVQALSVDIINLSFSNSSLISAHTALIAGASPTFGKLGTSLRNFQALIKASTADGPGALDPLDDTAIDAVGHDYDLDTVTPLAGASAIYGTGDAASKVRAARPYFRKYFEEVHAMLLGLQNSAASLMTTNEGILQATDVTYAAILRAIKEEGIPMPPSGAIVGRYAAIDESRGVWKAPANTSLNSVVKLSVNIDDDEQEDLNVDVNAGKSINAIRKFTGKGILIWGARTLAGNDNEWRYVPVRRLFIFVEESVKKASEFVVFEPNDAKTWVRMKGMISNFLTGLWRDGGLAGAKPDEAFFVKVGLGETMTSQDVLEGRLIVEIGMAAVRPAEFIILRFMHKLQES